MKLRLMNAKLIGDGRKLRHAVRFSVSILGDSDVPLVTLHGCRILNGQVYPPATAQGGGYRSVADLGDRVVLGIRTLVYELNWPSTYPEVDFPEPVLV